MTAQEAAELLIRLGTDETRQQALRELQHSRVPAPATVGSPSQPRDPVSLTRDAIIARLKTCQGGPLLKSKIRNNISRPRRAAFPEALQELCEEGAVEISDDGRMVPLVAP